MSHNNKAFSVKQAPLPTVDRNPIKPSDRNILRSVPHHVHRILREDLFRTAVRQWLTSPLKTDSAAMCPDYRDRPGAPAGPVLCPAHPPSHEQASGNPSGPGEKRKGASDRSAFSQSGSSGGTLQCAPTVRTENPVSISYFDLSTVSQV